MTQKYITTAIPYMNGAPHIGHAMDYCLADTCARYFRLKGDNVRLQAGTDEHGSKIWQKAKELGLPVKEYVTENMEECIEALKEFCVEAETVAEKFLSEDWEYFDVTIRCHLLNQAISEVLEEIDL